MHKIEPGTPATVPFQGTIRSCLPAYYPGEPRSAARLGYVMATPSAYRPSFAAESCTASEIDPGRDNLMPRGKAIISSRAGQVKRLAHRRVCAVMSRKTPSPLAGEGWGGGSARGRIGCGVLVLQRGQRDERRTFATPHPNPLTLPRKGGGNQNRARNLWTGNRTKMTGESQAPVAPRGHQS